MYGDDGGWIPPRSSKGFMAQLSKIKKKKAPKKKVWTNSDIEQSYTK